jgi:hypothetical protein
MPESCSSLLYAALLSSALYYAQETFSCSVQCWESCSCSGYCAGKAAPAPATVLGKLLLLLIMLGKLLQLPTTLEKALFAKGSYPYYAGKAASALNPIVQGKLLLLPNMLGKAAVPL